MARGLFCGAASTLLLLCLVLVLTLAKAFLPAMPKTPATTRSTRLFSSPETITSPFESGVSVSVQIWRWLGGWGSDHDDTCFPELCWPVESKSPRHSTPSPFHLHYITSQSGPNDDFLPLTYENVELVLDEMRPYLMSDGYVDLTEAAADREDGRGVGPF